MGDEIKKNEECCNSCECENIEKVELDETDIVSQKLKEMEDKYLRVYADFENTKKRLEKEKYQALEYANEKFARELLPVLDSIDLALNSINSSEANESISKLKEGIELTIEQFGKILSRNGIEVVDTNCEFNPNMHEAIMQVDSENHESGQIVAVLQKGYKYKDRILRPTLVSVCK